MTTARRKLKRALEPSKAKEAKAAPSNSSRRAFSPLSHMNCSAQMHEQKESFISSDTQSYLGG